MNPSSVLLVFGVVACAAEVQFKPNLGCYQNGKAVTYVKYKPDLCTVCECGSNGIACWVAEYCSPPRCVDAVHHPDKCCPECPNGKRYFCLSF